MNRKAIDPDKGLAAKQKTFKTQFASRLRRTENGFRVTGADQKIKYARN